MNRAFVTKLAWNLCTQPEKPWVQLVKAKHLRGRRIMDIEHTRPVSSWIWGGIRSCLSILDGGMCYQVGKSSMLNIRQDAWLPQLPNHRLPSHLVIPPQLVHVCDLMTHDGLNWNPGIIRQFCPPQVAAKIIHTPILNVELDRLIWCPSTSGQFTIKSAYRQIDSEGEQLEPAAGNGHCWKMIWNANLHGRHAILLWRWLQGAVPTLDKLQHVLNLSKNICYLCGHPNETIHHLNLECLITKFIWWHSAWQFRLEAFQHLEFVDWVQLIFGEVDRLKMQLFLVITVAQVWLARN